MKDLEQLLFKFKKIKNYNSEDFFVSESNFFAYNLVLKWPNWGKNILNLYGEKFCGKSHLCDIFQNKFGASKIEASDLSKNFISQFKTHQNLIIENFTENIDENTMYSLINIIDRDNKFILINSTKPINKLDIKLKDLLSRLNNCIFAEINIPDDELIFAILLKNFSDKQIQIKKKYIEFIIKNIDRSYEKIYEFINKIDQTSLKRKKSIDLKLIKEALKN
ncbi:MAG: DNA replication protein [Pelagibacteraceae bacterium TMED287]|nr:MAG: DNA replication protein [Pelagibacteraceae bacterium TMED287]|tara:strand:+ start:357 stop:1019 length:663 start_codon:yes stop_codon:yes gene_type:complete